jgi:hypothetical protein
LLKSLRNGAAALAALLFATSVAGCGSGPATPAQSLLSDPQLVVSTSLLRFEAASTFHVHGPVSGSIDPDAASALLGGGSTGISGKLKLDGASVDGDFDMAHQAFHVSASLPSLFGSSVDAILVDGYAYTKVSTPLSPSAALYKKSQVQTSELMPSSAPGATFSTAGILGELVSALDASAATATLVGQDTVNGRTAYHISEILPVDLIEREAQSAGLLPAGAVDLAARTADLSLAPVDYWVYDDSLQPASIRISLSSPTIGNVLLVIVLSAYDGPVTIQAPPDSQVSPG